MSRWSPQQAPQTNAVVWSGRIFFKSDAALTVLKAVPRVVRDPVYDLIARNRYAIFGRTETCMVPSADDRARFLM